MPLYQFRYVISVAVLGSILTAYIGRLNLAIAIVYMTKTQSTLKDLKSSYSNVNQSDVCYENEASRTLSKLFEYDSFSELEVKEDGEEKFDWDETTTGHILSAFFYGYILTQIPVGALVNRYGPRLVCSVGLIGTGLINLLTPLIVVNSFGLFIASRVLMGLVQSGIFASLYSAVTRWVPDNERRFEVLFCYSNCLLNQNLLLLP